MSKMVPCKTCGVEVARGALTCPKCGGIDPGVHVMRGIAILIGLTMLLFGLLAMLGGIDRGVRDVVIFDVRDVNETLYVNWIDH